MQPLVILGRPAFEPDAQTLGFGVHGSHGATELGSDVFGCGGVIRHSASPWWLCCPQQIVIESGTRIMSREVEQQQWAALMDN